MSINTNQGPSKNINIDVPVSIHNRFDIEVIDTKTNTVRLKGVGYNTICNYLWTSLLGNTYPAAYFAYIHYGSGSGTPAATDTSLFNFVGYLSTSEVVETMEEDTGIAYTTRLGQIMPEVAVGTTITEVGIASSSNASGYLCTHAMLQDLEGNPLSITKTDTDLINVYATIYLHVDPTGYMNHSVFICGNTSNWSFAHCIFGRYENAHWPKIACGYEAYGMFNMGVTSDTVSVTTTPDLANKTLTLTPARMSVNNNNLPMSQVLIWSYNYTGGSYGGQAYGPAIQLIPGKTTGWFGPTTITGEAIGTGDGTTTVFSTDFPFATNATIYVDGTAVQSGVTVSPGCNARRYPNKFVSAIKSISRPGLIYPSSYDISGYRNMDESDNTSMYIYTDRWYYFYNPFAGYNNVTQVYAPQSIVQVSPDMENWTELMTITDNNNHNVSAEYQAYPYWRMKRTASYSPSWGNANHYGSLKIPTCAGNITFDTPPAEGAVITADYTTSIVPKDTNHVLDITVTIQFGEYIES